MASALAIEQVSHAFGATVALDRVDLAVSEGQLVCLLGPSGCGKTTLLRLVAGLEDLQRGRIAIGGTAVAEPGRSVPPEQRGVGLVFQDSALFPHLDVAGNVGFGLVGENAESRRERIAEVLDMVEMQDRAAAYPHMLSGGQQQRVALARALAPRPKLILLDEPFSGLDTRLRAQVRDDTLHILKRSGATAIMVTHDAEEAMFMADRIALMNAGRIVQSGEPVDLYCRPANAFAAEFFSEVNRFTGQVAGGAVVTPLGRIDAGGLANGTRVEVLIRPEALRLSTDVEGRPIEGATAKVIAARLLGRTSLIHLCLGDGRDRHLHFHSRMPGRFLPAENEVLGVQLDLAQTFIFPLTDTK